MLWSEVVNMRLCDKQLPTAQTGAVEEGCGHKTEGGGACIGLPWPPIIASALSRPAKQDTKAALCNSSVIARRRARLVVPQCLGAALEWSASRIRVSALLAGSASSRSGLVRHDTG